MFKRENPRQEAQRQVTTEATVTTNLLTWLAIHGNLCLALRHPKNSGPTRQYIIKFVKELGQKLVEWKVITPQELQAAEHLEQEESPHGF